MKIKLDNSKVIDVAESMLTVKGGKLYNKMTNKFEGLDGDEITFYILDKEGKKLRMKGIVEGYTCNRRIQLKGARDLYAAAVAFEKTIVHKSTIIESDCQETLEEKAEEDWTTAIS